ncbi:MAG: MaoC family dehydratase [Planctomycetota bacterium]|nr:MAG: MaoC family dehydratase [Planctomycetota bacterium]
MAGRTIGGIDELRSLVGQEVGLSDWVSVTQEMIDKFADLTGDHQWIHVDVERSKRESPFGTTIAHGFLTLSLLTRLHTDAVQFSGERKMGINYGLNRVRFVSPVRAGARVRARSAVQSVDDFRGGVQVTWKINVEMENEDKPALVAEWIGRMYE